MKLLIVHFISAERFGDGDTSQIALDLDEVNFQRYSLFFRILLEYIYCNFCLAFLGSFFSQDIL